MKKICFASAWLLGLAVVASCSSDNELSEVITIEEASKTITNSDVEIRLSSGANGTRSSVESDDNGVFELNGLGVYCLAKGNLSINTQELPILWNPDDVAGRYSVWMNNVLTNAVKSDDNLATNLKWVDAQSRWYPTGNWHAYTFYAYYPYDASAKFENNQVVATFDIDGTQDIICGKTSNSDVNAFSAYYFRQLEHATETPVLSLSHKLMRLNFRCIAGADAYGSTEAAKKMAITSIKILNVPTHGKLVIADKDNSLNEGVLTFDPSPVADLDVRDLNDAPMTTEYWVQDTHVAVGQGILLPVPASADQKYYIQVTMKDNEGNVFAPEYPMELRNGETPFEAGKAYNINLIVHGPKLIDLNAKLDKWVEDNTTIGDVNL